MDEGKRQRMKNGNPRAVRERDRQVSGNRSHPAKSSASTSDAFSCIFARAQVQPELRATNQLFQCTVALRCGQAQRGTGCVKRDARKYRQVRKYCTRVVSGVLQEGTTSRDQFPWNMLSSLC